MLSLFMLGIACFLFTAINWQIRKFGKVTYEQILFHMNISLDDETKLFESFLQNTVLVTVIFLLLVFLLFGVKWQKQGKWQVIQLWVKKYQNKIAFLSLIVVFGFVLWRLNIAEIIKDYRSRNLVSDFYEKYYIYPQEVEIEASQNKRNLILIFLESMEASLFKDSDDFMPEIAKLAKDNVNFKDNGSIGGFWQADGTQWTQAALVSQTCGVPLHLPIENHNKFLPKYGYLPKAWCLYDVLKKYNYNQTFVTGMAKHYAGVDKFFETHGQVKILDWAVWENKYGKEYIEDDVRDNVLRDNELYEEAKKEILSLSSQKEPFAFTMMTLDTHFGEEYFDDKNCDVVYKERYKNVYRCASKKVYDFVNWIKKQDFYNNTNIVLVSDHLVMNDDIFDEKAGRRNLNIFINGAKYPQKQMRSFSSFDIYPTILESMGFEILGHRLGLGVSLYANIPTLTENIRDVDEIDADLGMHSLIYDEILYGKKM